MKYKNLGRFIWSIWGYMIVIPVVITTATFIVIANLIFGKKAQNLCLFIAQKISCNIICWGSLIYVKKIGRQHIQKDKGYVIIGNHNSDYDIFIDSVVLPWANLFCFLSKSEIGQIPVFGIIARNLAVLVDRSSMKSRVLSMRRMKEVLDGGKSVWIYAEGTRNKSDEPLLEFKDGAFKLAMETKAPIIVSTLVGIRDIQDSRYKMDLSPGIITCYFEEPIYTDKMTSEDLPFLKEQVKNLMLSRLNAK